MGTPAGTARRLLTEAPHGIAVKSSKALNGVEVLEKVKALGGVLINIVKTTRNKGFELVDDTRAEVQNAVNKTKNAAQAISNSSSTFVQGIKNFGGVFSSSGPMPEGLREGRPEAGLPKGSPNFLGGKVQVGGRQNLAKNRNSMSYTDLAGRDVKDIWEVATYTDENTGQDEQYWYQAIEIPGQDRPQTTEEPEGLILPVGYDAVLSDLKYTDGRPTEKIVKYIVSDGTNMGKETFTLPGHPIYAKSIIDRDNGLYHELPNKRTFWAEDLPKDDGIIKMAIGWRQDEATGKFFKIGAREQQFDEPEILEAAPEAAPEAAGGNGNRNRNGNRREVEVEPEPAPAEAPLPAPAPVEPAPAAPAGENGGNGNGNGNRRNVPNAPNANAAFTGLMNKLGELEQKIKNIKNATAPKENAVEGGRRRQHKTQRRKFKKTRKVSKRRAHSRRRR